MLPPDEHRDNRHQEEGGNSKAECESVEDQKGRAEVVGAEVVLVDGHKHGGVLVQGELGVVDLVGIEGTIGESGGCLVEDEVDESAGVP